MRSLPSGESGQAPTVLVTGGAGYVGSHACKALREAGYLPVAYDNLSRGNRSAVLWGPLVHGDTADYHRLDAAIREHRPVAIMHFAAYAYVGESIGDPASYYRNNVAGTLALLEVMHSHGMDKLVFSSSCATYGVPEHVPISEAHPQRPVNPYGASKLMVERILDDFDSAYGMRSVALRYFNAAGADPDGEVGEAHDPETHLIPLAIEAALGRRRDVEVFGTDYATSDGTAVRDYVHVTDLARGHLQALQYLLTGGASTKLNLGNEMGHSVREIIASVERVTGAHLQVKEAPRRPGDPPMLVADARKAREVIGWRPAYAELDEIIGTAWQWHRELYSAHAGCESH